MPTARILIALAGSAGTLGQGAAAQSLPLVKQLPPAIANQAVLEAVAACRQSGYLVSATVVDVSGLVKAVAKGNGAPPHTLVSRRGKAYAAVSLGPNSALSIN